MTYEFLEIIEAYKASRLLNLKTVFVTVVEVEGSSYRRPGVGMLIREDHQMTGAVSGGCVEKEILKQSEKVFIKGRAIMMQYDGRYRLGCEGTLYILIEPFTLNKAQVIQIENSIEERKTFTIESFYSKNIDDEFQLGSRIVFEDQSSLVFHQQAESLDNISASVFKREILPLFQVLVYGTEHDAASLTKVMKTLRWKTVVMAKPNTTKRIEDFPDASLFLRKDDDSYESIVIDEETAIILMSHNFAQDLVNLQSLIYSQPSYIGLLGPAKRREKLISALIEYHPDVSDEFLDIIKGPTGLNIGAETPEEIAISIIAEILACKNKQSPISLSEKKEGIHHQQSLSLNKS